MLTNAYLLLQESADKKIKRLREINDELDKMTSISYFFIHRKELNGLNKESDLLYATIRNEVKAMEVIEKIILGEN